MKDALREIERDKYLNLVSSLMEVVSQKKIMQVEELIVYAKDLGYTSQDTYLAIDKLKDDGLVEDYGDGYLRRLI
jgi:DNA-binding MarR family transcriptional regulator